MNNLNIFVEFNQRILLIMDDYAEKILEHKSVKPLAQYSDQKIVLKNCKYCFQNSSSYHVQA
jgi:hypothetical protein